MLWAFAPPFPMCEPFRNHLGKAGHAVQGVLLKTVTWHHHSLFCFRLWDHPTFPSFLFLCILSFLELIIVKCCSFGGFGQCTRRCQDLGCSMTCGVSGLQEVFCVADLLFRECICYWTAAHFRVQRVPRIEQMIPQSTKLCS